MKEQGGCYVVYMNNTLFKLSKTKQNNMSDSQAT